MNTEYTIGFYKIRDCLRKGFVTGKEAKSYTCTRSRLFRKSQNSIGADGFDDQRIKNWVHEDPAKCCIANQQGVVVSIGALIRSDVDNTSEIQRLIMA